MVSFRRPGSHAKYVMTENPITSEIDSLVNESEAAELRDLLPFTIGGRTFAVFTDQVDGTAESKPFAALPRAPRAVVGVVCVRGRMLTVLDPAAVLDSQALHWDQILPYVIVLRGDEQLGLVAESCRDTITISAADIERSREDEPSQDGFLIGLVRYAGEEMLILDSARLFARAVQRRERRRRRI
ncbi:MAG TPA: chemotaxis protein CheW [Pyrinomonadaceae bacterium]